MTSAFHEGERTVQALAGEAAMAERNAPMIAARILSGALPFLRQQPMALLAYADRQRQLWVSTLFGTPGFLQSNDGLVVDIDLEKAAIQEDDPLWESIGSGTPAGMLVIEPGNRRRIRINGDLTRPERHRLHLAVRESYPNCPKYITRRVVRVMTNQAASNSAIIEGTALRPHQTDSVGRADVLFIGTVHPERGIDASHRGGAAGFIRMIDERTLQIPDYVGNSMFNTLGNLAVDARAGITIPDFSTRKILQLSGTAETLWNQADEAGITGGTHRLLRFHVDRWKEQSMPPRVQAEFIDYSPFNPPVPLS